MTKEDAIELGFKPMPHFTIGDVHRFNLGRNTDLSYSSIGTPNEYIYICETEEDLTVSIDAVCIHNYDYDGYMSKEKLSSIIMLLKQENKLKQIEKSK